MSSASPLHPTRAALDAALGAIREAPKSLGRLDLIVLRPDVGERDAPVEARLDEALGLLGDSWSRRPGRGRADGSPDPDKQLTVMSIGAVAAVAGPRERWPLAGDQLYVDFDLSEENLPAGARFSIGPCLLEVTAPPHTGCAKFAARFGNEALKWVNSPEGRALRLRGVNAKVVGAGVVRVGDKVVKVEAA